jgi:peptidyl-prolyl cis-trans isomerase SurA
MFTTVLFSINFAEVFEEIVAVVNDEIIVYSELRNAQAQWMMQLREKYQGQELETAIQKMKKDLLDSMIERKIVISKAKEKKYDLENDLEIMLKDIKKQNNLNSDEELKAALRAEGIDFDDYKEQLRLNRMQQRFLYEEVGAQIEVDNSQIMEYYKEHIDEFTKPLEMTLHCIYLDPANYPDNEAIEEKNTVINSELSEAGFPETAKKYSELAGAENNTFLGTFKKGELDPKIEAEAIKLQEGKHSSWIETDSGWYLVQMAKRTEPSLIEYKEVRENIHNKIRDQKYQQAVNEFLEQLKKESYIKIYKSDL